MLIIFLTFVTGCQAHLSPLNQEQKNQHIFAEINEEEALELVHETLVSLKPGSVITELSGPIKGLRVSWTWLLDHYQTTVRLHFGEGIMLDGTKVVGIYPDVSGSGTLLISGPAFSKTVYDKLMIDLSSISQKVNVTNLHGIRRSVALSKDEKYQPKQRTKKPSEKSPPPSSGSTGSGFFVSKLGHIVTNEHVVRQCGSVTVGDNANKQVSASVLETDKRNDLALLRISSTQMASVETKSLISKLGLKLVPLASGGLVRSEDVQLGEDVLVAGYPYGELYSNTIKVTGGMVSAVKGMGDDSAQFQMDAAVQPGNSGGPIYDENGNIVGVVISQLNKLKVAKAIGSLPENVNFGIKASTVRQFLTSAGLPTKWSNRTERKSTKELAQIAKNQTVMVVCNP